jgi:phage recombination protein Bet
MVKKEAPPPPILSQEMQAKKDAFMKDYDENVTKPMSAEEEMARKAAFDAAKKRNADALGDINAPGVISNETAVVTRNFNDVPVTRVAIDPQAQEKRIALIKAKIAPNATDTEFELLMYMANKFDLDPLIKEIWLVKFGISPAQIYAGRDGYLKIAHRSGQFDGMKTVVEFKDDKPFSATCTVWRKDMSHPIESNVLISEYTTGQNLWKTKPAVMIGKVAESVALRKAFSVSGMYSPDEMGD